MGKTSADIAALGDAIWGVNPTAGNAACKRNKAGGRSYFLSEKPSVADLTASLAQDAGIPPVVEVLEGDTGGWLHVLHRIKNDRDVFFITNQNLIGDARKFHFRITAAGVPECWDPMRNEITAVIYHRTGKSVEMELTLEPSESVLLVFQPKSRSLPVRGTVGKTVIPVTVDASIPVEKDPEIPTKPGSVTRSPVASNNFHGRCELTTIPERAVLELDDLAPEAAARVTINGQYAGGFIGKPFRLDVTKHLKPGVNHIDITPFAPKTARLICVW